MVAWHDVAWAVEQALDGIGREYPNQLVLALDGPGDVGTPRQLTPVFFGCYDWHSAVHSHWLLVRCARLWPREAEAAGVFARLDAGWAPEAIAGEVAFLDHPLRRRFETPYGMAWLLTLLRELRLAGAAGPWAVWVARLVPLEKRAVARLESYFARLPFPVRVGEHAQTAWPLEAAWRWARVAAPGWAVRLEAEAERLFGADAGATLRFEPGGTDFWSPTLAEAALFTRLRHGADYAAWLERFLPDLGIHPLAPAEPPDRDDGKLVHLDGLNLSRAWMLAQIADALPEQHGWRPRLLETAAAHARAGREGARHRGYMGTHWLGTFAVYGLTEAWRDAAPLARAP